MNKRSRTPALRVRIGDFFVVGAVLALAGVVFWLFAPTPVSTDAHVVIAMHGEVLHTLPLSDDTSVAVDGQYHNTITIERGTVFFAHSDCPGLDCVHTPPLRYDGQVAACLPNGVSVLLRTPDGADDAPDVVIH